MRCPSHAYYAVGLTPAIPAAPQPYLETLLGGGSLTTAEVEDAFDKILEGADPIQVCRHTHHITPPHAHIKPTPDAGLAV
jgi:hypothetical protein